MRLILIALLSLVMTACKKDETVAGHGGAGKIWALESINDKPFSGRAEIEFHENGKVTGAAPCNRFFTEQHAPYPWIEFGPVGATKMACPDLAAETAFFEALGSMTLVEVLGDTMILRNDDGNEMVFRTKSGG